MTTLAKVISETLGHSDFVIVNHSNANEPTQVLDQNDNPIDVDISAAEAELASQLAAIQYKVDRESEYPPIGEQLDYIYHNGVEAWKSDIINPIKARYPKP